MKREITETLYIFSGILYQLEEEDYEQTKHQGFSEYQELPISLEGYLVGRYIRELLLPERTYLLMMEDENPPSVVAKGWNVSPAYFPVATTFYAGSNLIAVTENDGDFVCELIVKQG